MLGLLDVAVACDAHLRGAILGLNDKSAFVRHAKQIEGLV
jgi:hypothetical protein